MRSACSCSIIICTRNRAESLKQTLYSVLQQQYDDDKAEVIVVDNGSTDQTQRIVESFVSATPYYPVRYVLESTLGLSHARNCGMKQARGEIVIFLDDDALPRKTNWVQRLVSAYNDPRVSAAGGDLEPIWPDGMRPVWVHDLLLYSLGLTQFDHAEITETHYPLYPWGANLSYRKERIQRLGGFAPQLGRMGDTLLSGEETELCLRLEKAGEKIVYVPDAVVDHVIAPGRVTIESFKHHAACQGISEARIEVAHLTRVRRSLEVIRRLAMLAICVGGTMIFSALRSPKLALLCTFKRRSAWSYILTLLDRR